MRNPLIAFIFVIGLFITSSAVAQERGVVQGVGGMTFGTETSTMFGGGFGVDVAPNLQITGEFGRMQNILPKRMQNKADEGAHPAEDIVFVLFRERVNVAVDAQASAFFVMGGARFLAPAAGRVRPFVDGSAGFARVTPSIGLVLDREEVTAADPQSTPGRGAAFEQALALEEAQLTRNASTGSVFSARRAGIQQANSATADNPMTTAK